MDTYKQAEGNMGPRLRTFSVFIEHSKTGKIWQYCNAYSKEEAVKIFSDRLHESESFLDEYVMETSYTSYENFMLAQKVINQVREGLFV
jgi:hypothetical protein